MELKKINLILLIVGILLVVNLFYDFDMTGSVVVENLRCKINGEFVYDANLCCHEMQKFLSCEDNRCESKNYEILFDDDLLKYCKKSDYDVRT